MKLTCIVHTFRFFWDINIMIMHCFAMLQTVRYLFDICKYVHKLLFNCVICELYQKQLHTKYNNLYPLYILVSIIYVLYYLVITLISVVSVRFDFLLYVHVS